uniref:Major facilitator superfamily (MFS) profile domain-containing protein n=1 Tax=Fagus sylvatica TaxID=28930 RepID=A0A2N9G741_FAGSY
MGRLSSNKWIATVASIWIQSSCGSDTFSIFSSILKSSQGYDQSTLDIVSVFKDIGGNAGVLAGLLYSAVTVNNCSGFFGPWVVHVAGAIQSFLGYFFMWASVVGLIERPPVALMCLFMFLSTHSSAFFTTANVVTGLQNFPQSGGTIVGIMKGFLGISGAILIQVYGIFCKGKPSTFILMLALLPTFVSIVLMFFVRIHEANTVDDMKHLNVCHHGHTLLRLYFFCFYLHHHLELRSKPRGRPRMLLAYHELPDGEGQVNALLDDKVLIDEEGMNLLQAICNLNFWLLFMAMVCGMGSGLAVINNFSQIGQSLNYTTVEVNNLVSLWSIWNFVGRIGAGYLSDYLLHTRGWTRPLLMAITLATMSVGHIVVASGFPGILYMGSILVAICYGSQWALMPTITSEIFGVRHMGTIFNTIGVACPVGSYIFSVRIIGYIYDMEAGGEGYSSCFGTHCFMLSLLIMASVALLGSLAAFALFFRTKRFYQLVVLKRLRQYSLR